ncbi:hypothetical protein Scep_005598 [Stephania cephalantha]|uniref:Uncharacterized protein n=1 Tax=Stephania cephalantha TaxID=152367 RepID=A0AAP0PYC1_9MAGN
MDGSSSFSKARFGANIFLSCLIDTIKKFILLDFASCLLYIYIFNVEIILID